MAEGASVKALLRAESWKDGRARLFSEELSNRARAMATSCMRGRCLETRDKSLPHAGGGALDEVAQNSGASSLHDGNQALTG